MRRCALLLAFLSAALADPAPAGWVPARWPWTDLASLELLATTPVNCLLVRDLTPEFAAAAAERGVSTLAIIPPVPDPVAAVRKAIAAKAAGIVLEGDFPESVLGAIRAAAGPALVIPFGPRSRVKPGAAPISATNQGVWPGIGAPDENARRAGPTSSNTWIDTNTGFLRAAHAAGAATLWIANEPPPKTAVTLEGYQHAIADAAMSGARWVVAFDADLAARLAKRDARAVTQWRRMADFLTYFEQHPEWRDMHEFGKLAVVQDPARGVLLSGGILDMIAVKHAPVRPIASPQLTSEKLAGATLAVNVDQDALTPDQKETLRAFAGAGNTLLNVPPGPVDRGDRIALDKSELERTNAIWTDVNNMIGRRNLGVRLFNVASVLSNALESADGKTLIVHLVNYADYPVQNVTVHFLGDYKRAVLLGPENNIKILDIYPTEDAHGVDVDQLAACATIRLEK
jgi:hypothetical protein